MAFQQKSTPIVNWLKRDIKANNTPIVIFCGRPRSGKTAFAMRVAWEIYPNEFAYSHVVDSIEAFALAMKQYRNTIIILDEATTSLYVYDWNSFLQKIFTIIQDSQAYRHNTVFIILPMLYKLGKLHRYDADAIIEMRKMKMWNPDKMKYEAQYFYKYLIHKKQYSSMKMKDPILMMVVERCGPVPLPPPHIWNPYIDVGQAQFKEKILEEQLDAIIKRGVTVAQKKEHIITVLR